MKQAANSHSKQDGSDLLAVPRSRLFSDTYSGTLKVPTRNQQAQPNSASKNHFFSEQKQPSLARGRMPSYSPEKVPDLLQLQTQNCGNDARPTGNQVSKDTASSISTGNLESSQTAVSTATKASKKKRARRVPDYKRKEKTEMCKNWAETKACVFGDKCTFAHGEDQLMKKKHVAGRYKIALCRTYHSEPYCCLYGSRCQFVHLVRSLCPDPFASDAVAPSPLYLLAENARQMYIRINGVANPDVVTFNVAFP